MVLKVVFTSARFGELGALLYGEVLFLERLVAICSVFWRIDDSGFKNLQECYKRIIYAARIAVDRFSPATWLALNMPCQAVRAGNTDRGDRKSGANGCRGASWSEELDGKQLCGALGGKRNWSREDPRFLDIVYPSFFTDHSVVC